MLAKPINISEIRLTRKDYRNEKWKPCPGFPTLYHVSNMGRVKSLGGGKGRKPGRILRPGQQASGHFLVILGDASKGIKNKPYRVHRLVCMAFNGLPPKDKPFALHDDGDVFNNKSTNLYWGTHKVNMEDKLRHGTSRKGGESALALLSDRRAERVLRRLMKGYSVSRVMSIFGVPRSTVEKIGFGLTYTNIDRNKLLKSLGLGSWELKQSQLRNIRNSLKGQDARIKRWLDVAKYAKQNGTKATASRFEVSVIMVQKIASGSYPPLKRYLAEANRRL